MKKSDNSREKLLHLVSNNLKKEYIIIIIIIVVVETNVEVLSK
jgi:hypothetical protein